jgi:diguanylate cyclase (GGDEF)-like protein/PAS domain S-box-containing protein
MARGVEESTDDTATADAALAALVHDRPDALFCALGDDGFRIAMPATLAIGAERVIPAPPSGRATMVDLVIPSDAMSVVTTWERARQTGIAKGSVRALSDPDAYVTITILDARAQHGVWIGALSNPDHVEVTVRPSALPEALAVSKRPRTATMTKSLFGIVTAIDERVTRMLGWSDTTMVGVRSLEFIHPEDCDRAVSNWMDMLAQEQGHRVRYRHQCADDSWLWVEVEHIYHAAENVDDVVVTCHISDISDEMAAHAETHRREQLFRRLAESLPSGVLQVDVAGEVVYANARLSTLLGVHLPRTIAACAQAIAPTDRARFEAASAAVLADATPADFEVGIAHPDAAEFRRCHVTLTPLAEDTGRAGALMCISDITESAKLREELTIRASFDGLTGCYNRASVLDAVGAALAHGGPGEVGVIFIDLDGFKAINDDLGHAVGDELLASVAAHLSFVVRGADIVGRIGGDEFLVLCNHLEHPTQAQTIAARITEAVCRRHQLSSHDVDLRASIGVATSDTDSTAETLIARADAAMYEKKRSARTKRSA